jgi:hypothetical protein
MRTFTLSAESSEAVDELHASNITAPKLQFILQKIEADLPKNEAPCTDDDNLTPEDYSAIYAMFPPEKVSYPSPKLKHLWKSERLPSAATVFKLALREVTLNNRKDFYNAVRTETLSRQKHNRKWKPKKTAINASRIVDVLICLGAQALEERVASLGSERSKGKDAGKSQNKLSHSSRRKAAKV